MNSSEPRIAVLLDEQPLWHEAVAAVLCGAGFEVAGKATTAQSALALVVERNADLLVAEIPTVEAGTDPFAWLRELRERRPSLRVVVLAASDDEQLIDGALAAGADAYVLKVAHPEDLASAIRQVFRHSVYLPHGRSVAAPTAPVRVAAEPGLTRREVEILRLVAEGHSNASLARQLWVTEQTVKFHLSNVYRKLSVANRTEASRWAQLNGLLPSERDAAPTAVAVTSAA
jgi:DNA-binding NarL/FixJ family response regulator